MLWTVTPILTAHAQPMTSWAWENATMGRKDRIWEAQASTNRPIKLISEVGTAIKYWSFSAFASACKVTLLVSASILRGVEGSGIRYSDPPNHGSDSPHRSCHISLDFRNIQVLRIQSEPEKSEILERQRRDQDIKKLSLYPYIVSPRNVCQSSHRTYSITNYGCWIFLLVSSAHAMGCQETKFGDKTLRGERPFMHYLCCAITHWHSCVQKLENSPVFVPGTTFAKNFKDPKVDEVRWFTSCDDLWHPFGFSNWLKIH